MTKQANEWLLNNIVYYDNGEPVRLKDLTPHRDEETLLYMVLILRTLGADQSGDLGYTFEFRKNDKPLNKDDKIIQDFLVNINEVHAWITTPKEEQVYTNTFTEEDTNAKIAELEEEVSGLIEVINNLEGTVNA